jgi:hypothetical protein
MNIFATRNRLCRALFSTFLMTSLLVTVAPLSFAKAGQVPFRATFDTEFQSSAGFPVINITVQGNGHGLQIGNATTFSPDETVNLITGNATATFTLIAANGDTIVIFDAFNVTQVPGGVTFSGTYNVIGGTGRFAGATGQGAVTGSAQFTGEGIGVGDFVLDGTISSPGNRN